MEPARLPNPRLRSRHAHWHHIPNKIKADAPRRHNHLSKSKDSHRLSMGKQLHQTMNNQMQNCTPWPRFRPQTSGDNIKPSTMPVRTRSPATVQLQKHGLENLQAEAPKIPTKPRPPWNTHNRNSGQTGERHKHSHTASNSRDHTPSSYMPIQQKMVEQGPRKITKTSRANPTKI